MWKKSLIMGTIDGLKGASRSLAQPGQKNSEIINMANFGNSSDVQIIDATAQYSDYSVSSDTFISVMGLIYFVALIFIAFFLIRKSKIDYKKCLSIDWWKETLKKPEYYGHFFGFDGRVNRLLFLLYYLIFYMILFILILLLPKELLKDDNVLNVLSVIVAWFLMSHITKRFHDLGFCGWQSIIYIILYFSPHPEIGSFLMLPLFLLKGSENPYSKKNVQKEEVKKVSKTSLFIKIFFICLIIFLYLLGIFLIFS